MNNTNDKSSTSRVSLLPRDEHRMVPFALVIDSLAHELDQTRYTGQSFETAISDFFSAHRVVLPTAESSSSSVEAIADAILARIYEDTVYDSEVEMAARAATAVLSYEFRAIGAADASTSTSTTPTSIPVAGWLEGYQFVALARVVGRDGAGEREHKEWFTLTGRACPECGINPQCYGTGGGTRCLDTSGCGWSFCY